MPSQLVPFAIAALLVCAALAVWYVVKPADAGAFIRARIDYAFRLWNFFGPRLTDRNFVAAMLSNAAVLGFFSVAPEVLNAWTLGIILAANLFNPTWDSHPAGERVLREKAPDAPHAVEGAAGH